MEREPSREMELDPVFRNAVREALVILLIFAVALMYTVGYCYLFGYGRDAETITAYWGFPDWVCWGILAPWGVFAVVAVWFSSFYLKDDDLAGDTEAEFPDEDPEVPDVS
jgi:uncharacterized protein DUF997